jgi:bacteriocin biosynthesis cyclodehydratase domain-containing protein
MAEAGGPSLEALREALVHLFDPNVRLPPTPRLIDDLDVFNMPDGLGIQFRGGAFPVVIRGSSSTAAWTYLQEAMDGRTEVGEIVSSAPQTVSQVSVAKLLSLLHGKGLLQKGDQPRASMPDAEPLTRQVLFWGRHLGIAGNAGSGSEIQERLAIARVLLVGSGLFGLSIADLMHRSGVGGLAVIDASVTGAPSADWRIAHGADAIITESMDALGQRVDEAVDSVDLVICATVGVAGGVLSMVNRICCAAGTRLLLASSSEGRLDLGPLVQPGETACYECALLREQSLSSAAMENLLYRAHAETESARQRTIGEAVPVTTMYAALVATEAVRVLTGIAAPTLLNHMTSVEGVRGSMRTNRIPRVPRCPVCSRASVHTTATGPA